MKAFNQDFYTSYVRGELKPVLESIKQIAGSKVWLEIVYLVIPTLNDNPEEIRQMARWLKAEIGPDYPLHFSRFQPMYLIKISHPHLFPPWKSCVISPLKKACIMFTSVISPVIRLKTPTAITVDNQLLKDMVMLSKKSI